MIVARNGQIRPKSGHDHETARAEESVADDPIGDLSRQRYAL
jgi:hypothetical protein